MFCSRPLPGRRYTWRKGTAYLPGVEHGHLFAIGLGVAARPVNDAEQEVRGYGQDDVVGEGVTYSAVDSGVRHAFADSQRGDVAEDELPPATG